MSSPILGIIAPHPPIMVRGVGGARSDVTAASVEAMRTAATALQRFSPDTLVVISPHTPALSDAFTVDTSPRTAGTLANFGAPRSGIAARTDTEFAERLLEHLDAAGIPALSRTVHPGLQPGVLDHGVLVPLSFLDPEGALPLVNLSLSGLSFEQHRRLGSAVTEVAMALGRRIAFLASGDLSHRLTPDAPAGYSPRGKDFDQLVVDHVRRSDLDGLLHVDRQLAEVAGECGLRSLVTLSGVLPGAPARVLAYEGPWGVGYLTALVGDTSKTPGVRAEAETESVGQKGGRAADEEHELVKLARSAISDRIERGVEPTPEPLSDPSLPPRAGAFVSLHLDGQLRGCIGTILPTQPTLAEEVVRNAIQAATADPRFPTVSVEEVPLLEVKVDILHPPEECSFADLDPSDYGVIVSCGWRCGLLLPDLDGVDSAAQQVDIARRKAGIGPDDPCSLERFRVDRYT
ncbi:MAG: AmmeMemoRadiSam system protein A [Coriobacteriia bacterium]|nr:AmmeMemoRadiSam system protein A [Coriobacteriia bacterium]